jgi:hypothetical protein
MRSRRYAQFFLTMTLTLGMVACASRETQSTSDHADRKSAITTTLKKVSFARIPKLKMPRPFWGPKVKIVEPRARDLKNLPSGAELAMAYRKKQRGLFWIVGGPVDFKEPDLPMPGLDLEDGLLPPLPQ